MVCKYLFDIKTADGLEDPQNYYDVVACRDPDDKCPKKKIRHKLTPHCWRLK